MSSIQPSNWDLRAFHSRIGDVAHTTSVFRAATSACEAALECGDLRSLVDAFTRFLDEPDTLLSAEHLLVDTLAPDEFARYSSAVADDALRLRGAATRLKRALDSAVASASDEALGPVLSSYRRFRERSQRHEIPEGAQNWATLAEVTGFEAMRRLHDHICRTESLGHVEVDGQRVVVNFVNERRLSRHPDRRVRHETARLANEHAQRLSGEYEIMKRARLRFVVESPRNTGRGPWAFRHRIDMSTCCTENFSNLFGPAMDSQLLPGAHAVLRIRIRTRLGRCVQPSSPPAQSGVLRAVRA